MLNISIFITLCVHSCLHLKNTLFSSKFYVILTPFDRVYIDTFFIKIFIIFLFFIFSQNFISPWSHDENLKKQAYVQQYDTIYILKYMLKILSKICQICTFLSHYVYTYVCTWKTFFFCLNFGPFWTILSPCVQSVFR